jgi:hypothetical protein
MGSYCWQDDERHCYYYPYWWIPLAFDAAAFLLVAVVVVAAVAVAAVAAAAVVHCLFENLDLEQQMILEVLLEENERNERNDQDDDDAEESYSSEKKSVDHTGLAEA